jgi:hypothetical protein
MSTKQNWACALCGETFTRRSSGNRHNLNLHSGVSIIVRFTDFVIGVLDGRYKPPEPLATPIRRKSLQNFLDNKPINQHNKMSYFNGDRHETNNNYNSYHKPFVKSYSQDESSSRNFLLDNAAIIDSIIGKYEDKLKPFLSPGEIHKFVIQFIIYPACTFIDNNDDFNRHLKYLDNSLGYLRIIGRLKNNNVLVPTNNTKLNPSDISLNKFPNNMSLQDFKDYCFG